MRKIEVRNAGVTLPEGAVANLESYYPPGNQFLQIEGGLPVGAKPETFVPVFFPFFHFSFFFFFSFI
jgi:hypothetical protein